MRRFFMNVRYALNWKKPRLIIRLIRNYLAARSGKSVLRYVDLCVGYLCNMKCAHCFVAGKDDGRRVSPRYYGSIVNQAMRMGACSFSFQGGEPLMYPDLKYYIKAARPDRNLISITTNGTMLTPRVARELKSWGVDIVTVSIDSYRPEGSRLAAIKGIRAAMKAGLKVTVGMTVAPDDFNGLLADMIAFAKQRKMILLLIFPVKQGKLDSEVLSESQIKYLRSLEKKNPYVRTDFSANWHTYGCGAGKEILYIQPDGEVYACPFIPISFGNIGLLSLEKIRDKILKIKEFREYYPKCIAAESMFEIMTRGKYGVRKMS